MKQFFYRLRLSLLMRGYALLMQFAAFINREFRQRLAEKDFSFVMTSGDRDVARCFVCKNGRLRSTRKARPVLFKLIWRDNRVGGRIMLDMVRGRPKALLKAVEKGDLLLEGDAQSIGWYMKTSGKLARVFQRRR